MAIAALVAAQAINAQLVTINETFTGTTLSSGWQVGTTGSASYTPNLTAASGIDSAGSGWMRLTSAVGYEATYAYDSNSFSSANATVALKFSYASYGGNGADGITFFLADASKTFAAGSYGGSLGYAQRTVNGGGGSDVNGMSGGYIGLGLDEFGNYSNATEGRVGGVGFDPGNVSIRGPGQGLTGYDYLGGTGALATPIAFPGSTTRPTGVNERTFEVIITATNQLTVYMQAGAGAPINPLYSIDLSGYARPDNLVLGFTGSTGGSNDIHEVQGLLLTSQTARLWTNVGTTSTWNSASNWDGGSAIPAVGADILLDNHYVSSAQTISVGAGATRNIRSLQIDAPFSYTLDSSTLNNGTLQFNDQGVLGPSGIFVSQGHGSAVQTVNSNLIANNAIEIKNQSTSALNLNGTLANGGNVVTLSGSGTTNLSGVISGIGSITKNDNGTAALSGNNTYSGGTALTAGTISVGHNNALGTGALTITGGALASSAANTISNAISLQGNTSLSNITTGGVLTQSGGNYTVAMTNATQSGAVNLSDNNTGRNLTVGVDTGLSTISGVIQDGGTGAGGLTKIGTGTLTLTGANTYTGTSTITGGTLQLGGNDRLATGSGLNIGALGNFNLAGFSQKVGTLTAAGGASIDFGSGGASNIFVFGTYVAPASGVLVINNWSASDKLATTVAGQNVSTVYISGSGVASEAPSTSALGGTYGNGYLLTPISAVYKEWNGSANSTWTQWNNWNPIQAPFSNEIALFDSAGFKQPIANLDQNQTIAGIRFGSGATVSYKLTGNAGLTLTLAGSVPYIQQQSTFSQTIAIPTLKLLNSTVVDITAPGNLTISSTISGVGFSLIKDGTGAGKLILSGANTYSGGLYINNGIAQANNNGALGTGAATISSGATLEISGGRTLSNAISVGGAGVGGAGAIHSVNGTNTLSSTITESGDTTFAADTGTTLNLTGNLTGANLDTTFAGAGAVTAASITTGTGAVILNGTGTVTFNGGGTANTYTGTTTVNSGTLALAKTAGINAIAGNLVIGDGIGAVKSAVVQLNASNQISDTSAVTIGSDGLFNLNGQAETISSLSGAGNIDNTSGTANTLTVGDTTATTYSGIIQDTGGNLSLIKQGAGKLTLSGANTYAGATTLSGGILAIQNNTALGTGVLTLATGTNLEVSGNLTNVANAMNLIGPGTLANDGAIQSTGGSNKLSGLLTLIGDSRINADSGSTLTLAGNITGTGQALTLGGNGNITVTGNITTGAGSLTKDGTGYVILNPTGSSTYTGATAINAGTLEIQKTTSLGTAAGGATVASGATLAMSGSITTAETPLNLSGYGVGNSGALRSLSGTNTVSGAIALNAPTYVGVDAGTLTASGVISGATGSDLTKVGTGTLTISGAGANTMAGNFNVNDGMVILNKNAGVNATGNGTGALTIGDSVGAANSATVQLAANGQISTASAVTINADGKLDVNGQTQQIGSLAGSGSVALGAGAAVLTVGNASNTTFSGAVSTTGTGAITKTGTGTVVLAQTAGSNAFAAAKLNLNQGTVQLGASNILNTALNFNGGTLSVNGFNDTVSSATLSSSSILDFNSLAGVFDFTNGLYTAGTLTINNWAGSTSGGGASQLRLPGTVTGALLANISFSGYGAGAQIVNGEIVPITGTSYSWNVDSDGTWSNNANWNPSTNNPNGVGQSASFGNVITASRTVTLDTARTVGYLTFNSTNNYTIASAANRLTFAVSSGNAQLNVSGAGADTISAGVNLNNALVINQNSTGTLTLSNANAITGTAQNVTVGGAGNTVISGIIATTTGSLTKNNGGTLSLGGVNTYSGGTTINGGTVAISADNNLGATTGALTLNGGTLENTANLTLTASRALTVNAGGGTFQTDTGTNLIYNGVVAGAGVINKAGAGTFTTGGAGANTQTGAININAGVYEIAKTANVSAIGVTSAVTVASGATLKFNGTTGYNAETIGSLAGAGTVTNASALLHSLTVGGDGTSTTFSGALQNTGGALSLTKTGTGTMTLTDTGGLSNYTGTTTVSQGALNIQAGSALGSAAGGTSVTSGAALEVQGGIAVGAEALTLNGAGLAANANGALRNVSGNNLMGGAITLGSASTIKSEAGTLTLSGAVGGAQNLTLDGSGNITMSGAIGTGNGTLTKNGTGYATLSGNSTFTGTTTINDGTLEIQHGNALGTATGGVTVASGATLAMSGNITSAETPVTLNGVGDGSGGALRSLSGTNTLSGTSVVLASSSLVGVDAGTLTLSGAVSGAAGNNLTKVGAGTLVLTGANTYSGATVINAGTLQIDSEARLGAAPGGVTSGQLTFNGGTLATTATMNLSSTNTRGISLSTAGGTISTANATTTTFGGVIDGTGALTKAGAGTLVLSGANTFSGATNLNGGTLSINSDTQLGTAPTSATANQLTFNGGILATTGTTTLNANRGITLNAGGGGINVANGTTLTFGGTIAGTGNLSLALNGSGLLDLTSNLDLSLNTVLLSGGTLRLSGINLSVGTFHITGNTILDFGNSVASTLTTANFIVDAGVTVTVNNWVNGSDYFFANNSFTQNGGPSAVVGGRGSAPENQVNFNGFGGGSTSWIGYDHEITPVPEPSVYGAVFLGSCLTLLGWRRWKKQVASAV